MAAVLVIEQVRSSINPGAVSARRFLSPALLEHLVEVDKLYSAWRGYDDHMRRTGHYAALGRLLAGIRSKIMFPLIDLGAGSSELEFLLLEPKNGIKQKLDAYLAIHRQDNTPAIVCVDLNEENMLAESRRKLTALLNGWGNEYGALVGDDPTKHKIALVNARIQDLPASYPQFIGFAQTVVMSYVLHWGLGIEDKRELLEVAHHLVAVSGRFLSIEEFPLTKSSADTMPPELEAAITRFTTPITMRQWRGLLDSANFQLQGAPSQQPIDVHHSMYLASLFRKPIPE